MCEGGCSAHHVLGSSSFLDPGSNLIYSAPYHFKRDEDQGCGLYYLEDPQQ